uniref:Uncharacterized protein n=1 Tax=Siphoviridae sp. ctHip2 TaxID=2827830 RepID=A0A8S5RVL8_9CAUD|nr:MAG TPA: hypothetical protein [Siphoviridae sp. ctHip2]
MISRYNKRKRKIFKKFFFFLNFIVDKMKFLLYNITIIKQTNEIKRK